MNTKIVIDGLNTILANSTDIHIVEIAARNLLEQFHSTGKEKGLKWVRAEERLPGKSGYYHVKVLLVDTVYPEGCQFSTVHQMWGSGFDENVIEWLDEGE